MGAEMGSGAMIVRLDDPAGFGQPVQLPKGVRGIVMTRIGERVVFGTSEVGGVWTLLGEGELVDVTRGDGRSTMVFARIQRYDAPVIATVGLDEAGTPAHDPFALEELTPAQLDQIRARAFTASAKARPGMTVAERGSPFGSDSRDEAVATYSWVGPGRIPDAALAGRAIRAYGGLCALTGLPLCHMPNGQREGWVIPIFGDPLTAPDAVSMVIPVTGTFAVLYANGLLAITEQLTVWTHPTALPDPILWSLRRINPAMRLCLPPDPADWPDPQLARRHLHQSRL